MQCSVLDPTESLSYPGQGLAGACQPHPGIICNVKGLHILFSVARLRHRFVLQLTIAAQSVLVKIVSIRCLEMLAHKTSMIARLPYFVHVLNLLRQKVVNLYCNTTDYAVPRSKLLATKFSFPVLCL